MAVVFNATGIFSAMIMLLNVVSKIINLKLVRQGSNSSSFSACLGIIKPTVLSVSARFLGNYIAMKQVFRDTN